MHGIIGQLANDPARLAIVLIAAIAVIAILRRLSDLVLTDGLRATEAAARDPSERQP